MQCMKSEVYAVYLTVKGFNNFWYITQFSNNYCMYIICPKGLNIGQDTEKYYTMHLSKTYFLA